MGKKRKNYINGKALEEEKQKHRREAKIRTDLELEAKFQSLLQTDTKATTFANRVIFFTLVIFWVIVITYFIY